MTSADIDPQEALERRRAQNRVAQRRFRQKKAQPEPELALWPEIQASSARDGSLHAPRGEPATPSPYSAPPRSAILPSADNASGFFGGLISSVDSCDMGQERSSSSDQDTGHSHFKTLGPATDSYSPTASTILLSTRSPENAATAGSISAKQNISTSVRELTSSDARSSNNGWRNPLHIAARGGHNQVVQILLRSGKVSCDEEDSDDLTALMHAVIAGHTEAVQSLLLHGASITGGNCMSDKRRPSALHWAIQYRREDILRLLLTHCLGNKSLIDCFDNVGRTSLHLASELDYVAGVVVLLEFGADPRMNTLTPHRYAY